MKYFLLLCCACFKHVVAQTNYPNDIEKQIKSVENNLVGRVRTTSAGYNIADRMAYYHVKGLSIAVIHDYKIVWAKGYGWADEKEKRPVTIQTLFQASSNSKSINAIGVLKLVQERKLDLYTDINTYLKSWKFPDTDSTKGIKITLADLLSHTAGLNAVNFPGYNRTSKLPTIPEILDGKHPSNTEAVRSEFEPGLKFQYSGGGTTITRLIVADVTGQPYDAFMYEHVLKPMGMVNSFFTQPPPKNKLKLLATGYHSDGSEVEGKFKIYPEQGPDGLWATPSEMANYVIETMKAYSGLPSRILSQEMAKLQLTPYHSENAGLGVFIQKRMDITYFTHGAGNEGYAGQYYGSLTGGNGVVVYTNSDSRPIVNEVVNSVATVYGWKGFCDTTVTHVIELPDSISQKYVGAYLLDGKLATIFKAHDGYYYRVENDNLKMYFTNATTFFNQESLSEKTFTFDSIGNVTGISRKGFGLTYSSALKIRNADSLRLKSYEFGNLGWQFFENKKYSDAIAYYKRGLELYPEDESLLCMMAHAYLYKGDYDRAITIYGTQLRKLWGSDLKLEEAIQGILLYFKDAGYDVEVFDKVFNDLNIEKPTWFLKKSVR